MDTLNYWTGYFNDRMRDAAAAAGVWFVDVRERFDDHEVCGNGGEWIYGSSLKSATDEGRSDDFHPNTAGQQAYMDVLGDFIESKVLGGAPSHRPGSPGTRHRGRHEPQTSRGDVGTGHVPLLVRCLR